MDGEVQQKGPNFFQICVGNEIRFPPIFLEAQNFRGLCDSMTELNSKFWESLLNQPVKLGGG